MSPSPEQAAEYRAKARLCIDAAVRMANEESQVMMLDLAFYWLKLAEMGEVPAGIPPVVVDSRMLSHH